MVNNIRNKTSLHLYCSFGSLDMYEMFLHICFIDRKNIVSSKILIHQCL